MGGLSRVQGKTVLGAVLLHGHSQLGPVPCDLPYVRPPLCPWARPAVPCDRPYDCPHPCACLCAVEPTRPSPRRPVCPVSFQERSSCARVEYPTPSSGLAASPTTHQGPCCCPRPRATAVPGAGAAGRTRQRCAWRHSPTLQVRWRCCSCCDGGCGGSCDGSTSLLLLPRLPFDLPVPIRQLAWPALAGWSRDVLT